MGEKSWANIYVLKVNLILFELMESGESRASNLWKVICRIRCGTSTRNVQ
jgi:hypothetical protein